MSSDRKNERGAVSAVHALEATTIHRRQKGKGDDDSRALKREVDDAMGDSDEEHKLTQEQEAMEMDADSGEHPPGSEDCVTFLVVVAVIAVMMGMLWYAFMHMASPSELLNQRLQNAPKVETRHLHVHVDLAQLYNGHVTTVNLDRQLVCRQCAGTGVDLAEGFHQCHQCKGSGVRTYLQQIGPIQQHVRSACNVCKGRGQVAKKTCDVCHGHGHLRDHKHFDVVIDRGMRHGDTITIAGEGDQAARARPGDVVVHIVMMHPPDPDSSPQFTRRGDDLEVELSISLLEALVGFTRQLTHLDGRIVELKRLELVTPSTVWKIRQHGMPVRSEKSKPVVFGDLLVRFRIQYPTTTRLTPQEKSHVEELLGE